MSNIYADLDNEKRKVSLGSNNDLDYSAYTGSVDISKRFVKVWVGKNEGVGFKSEMNVYCNKRGFELFADTEDDRVIVNSLIYALKEWMEEVDYEEIIGVLEELKGLKATLCSYLEDISRVGD